VDLRDRRELNNGFGNALARAVELTLSPVIFGFLGFLLDKRLGTRPVFMLFLFAFTIGYLFWKQYVHYDAEMKEHERNLIGGDKTPRRESQP
jgi:F0F1-type ATP synthase assembly protein I